MTRLAVAVEGRTEEEFVKRILCGHLLEKGIDSTPILLGRGRGGNVSVQRLSGEMARLYRSFNVVTSLVDFYGFKDKGGKTVEELEECLLEKTCKRITRKCDERKLIPYVQRHEFEALLFSDVDAFSDLPEASTDLLDLLRKIRRQFSTPEDINDNSVTAPSKRILKLCPRYRKSAAGPLLAERMGLDVIRAACPRFDQWITRLESIGTGRG